MYIRIYNYIVGDCTTTGKQSTTRVSHKREIDLEQKMASRQTFQPLNSDSLAC